MNLNIKHEILEYSNPTNLDEGYIFDYKDTVVSEL